MHCGIHVDVPATGICTRCDQPTCDACAQEEQGKRFCPACAAFVAQRTAARPPRATPPPLPPSALEEPMIAAQPAFDLASPSPTGAAAPPEVFAGDVYAGDVHGDAGPPPPAASGAPPSGDIYQGPVGELHPGPPADVYRGPAPSPTVAARAAAGSVTGAAAPATGSTGRSILLGLGLGLVAAYVWYGVSIATNWKLGPIAAIVGALVGWASATGAGRRDTDVGLLAIVLALVSMAFGEYLIWGHIENEITQEQRTYEALVLEIGADRRYTTSELERFYSFGEDGEYVGSLQELSADERSEVRAWADDEYVRLTTESTDTEATELTFGAFLPYLVLNFWTVGFLFIGCGAAYRIASGNEAD